MDEQYIAISNSSLAISAAAMLVVAIIALLYKLNITRSILLGTVRSFAQLTIMGNVLGWIFDVRQWYLTVLMLIVMLFFATIDSYKRIDFRFEPKCPLKGLRRLVKQCGQKTFWYCLSSMVMGCIAPLAFMFYIVVRVSPWYNPQYIIPMSAMVISNTMTAISICLNTYGNELRLRLLEVETKLSLGARPSKAIELIRKNAVKAGLIPTINVLMVLGIVKLPGMMTGQILGGVAPVESVRYQLLVMYVISASTAISLFILAALTQRAVFNDREQIRYSLLK